MYIFFHLLGEHETLNPAHNYYKPVMQYSPYFLKEIGLGFDTVYRSLLQEILMGIFFFDYIKIFPYRQENKNSGGSEDPPLKLWFFIQDAEPSPVFQNIKNKRTREPSPCPLSFSPLSFFASNKQLQARSGELVSNRSNKPTEQIG